jgi:hypothetical protein
MVSVKEVFKVMAQVDHDLTTISYFDQQLGLIKNWVCHKTGSSYAINKLSQAYLLPPGSNNCTSETVRTRQPL